LEFFAGKSGNPVRERARRKKLIFLLQRLEMSISDLIIYVSDKDQAFHARLSLRVAFAKKSKPFDSLVVVRFTQTMLLSHFIHNSTAMYP
jgi:hypothetical protein